MAEYTANAAQLVAENQNVLFTNVPVNGNCSIMFREGSGLITLRGLTNQCRALFRISFGANIAVPSGATPGPISLSIAINGEPVPTSTVISTPATAGIYNNVACALFLSIPSGCCEQISVQNTSNQAISVQNANIIVERVA